MAQIEVRDVVKVFMDKKRKMEILTLDHIQLDVEHNEFLCLLGPSGCGKSTLLNLIAGFEQPTAGEILVNGQPVRTPGADRGVVFQQPTLMPWLPVWENVAFYLKLQGKRASERREIAQKFIDMVGLAGFENHFPYELSGGMSQRVGIARALLLNPAVILMDEPFAALDAQTRMDMQEELVKIWQQHRRTVIFVTHSVEEALVLGTKIAVMSHRPGKIKEIITLDLDRPRDVTSNSFNRLKRDILALLREEGSLAKAESS